MNYELPWSKNSDNGILTENGITIDFHQLSKYSFDCEIQVFIPEEYDRVTFADYSESSSYKQKLYLSQFIDNYKEVYNYEATSDQIKLKFTGNYTIKNNLLTGGILDFSQSIPKNQITGKMRFTNGTQSANDFYYNSMANFLADRDLSVSLGDGANPITNVILNNLNPYSGGGFNEYGLHYLSIVWSYSRCVEIGM